MSAMDEKHIPEQYTEKQEDLEQVYDSSTELDAVVVGKLRRKIDWHLIPLISVLYLCSFLDRVNIGKLSACPSTHIHGCKVRSVVNRIVLWLSINRKCSGRWSLYPHLSLSRRIQLGLINLFHRVKYGKKNSQACLFV